jgi:hypothetical protein
MFLTWWDAAGVLEIPRGRTPEDRAEWIHDELSRNFGTRNNSGTSFSRVGEGLADYAKSKLKGGAAFSTTEDYDYRPENMARYVTGQHACVLALSVYYGDEYSFSHAVPVLTATADGQISFNTWGTRISGKLKKIGENEKLRNDQKLPKEIYEIEYKPAADAPEWLAKKRVRFVLEASKWDGLIVATPFVRAEKK